MHACRAEREKFCRYAAGFRGKNRHPNMFTLSILTYILTIYKVHGIKKKAVGLMDSGGGEGGTLVKM